jgi:hypothetical protein
LASAQLKEQILKAVFWKIGHQPNKNASLVDVMIGFDHIDKNTFFDAATELVNDQILSDRGHGYVAFTPDGLDKVEHLMNPPPTVNQNTLNIGHAHNSPILQGINSHQTQSTTYTIPSTSDLQRLTELMTAHLVELNLTPEKERKAKAQLATIQAQLLDEPNPTIIKEAGQSLKNITEGAIGSLLASAAQPGVWTAIQSLMGLF